ncbi:hypothetical protein ACFCYI_16055 [Streptomyces sp. NPDC056257]|uniref:hypothetical protein n=1 Tax=unclassified Streptomyces TaxID=2593676 RepID=UPI0034264CE8
MSAPAGAQRDPRPSVVSMRTLLAAGVAATAVSTPPAREHVPGGTQDGAAREEAAPESEAA